MKNHIALMTLLFAGLTRVATASPPIDSGALDSTFGASGKVQIAPPHGGSTATRFDFIATDQAIQPDGKIVVVGYETLTYNDNTQIEEWTTLRLNVDGSPDATFGTGGMIATASGTPPTRPQSVALRADGRIVVGGTLMNGGERALVEQFTTSGNYDSTFGQEGFLVIYPASGDSNSISRILLDSDGSIDVAGTYYDNQGGFNGNQFFFDRVAANGSSNQPFQYEFGSGPNQDDHALDLAIDNQGRYVLVGYHRGAAGNYDCAAIRIQNNLYDVDPSFGSSGQMTLPFDLGGDNGDFCSAVAIFGASQYMVIGGHSTVDASGNQKAVIAMLDNDGNLYQYFSSGILYPAKLALTYGGPADADTTITKLIIDDNDTKYPQLLAIGTGDKTGVPYGDAFGVARFNLPGFSNFSLDTTFNGAGTQTVFFDQCPDGIGLLRTHDDGLSGAYAKGKLVVVGSTSCTASSANDMAVARFAPFDVIFNNGFDTPSI